MKIPKELTTVTRLSKTIALIMFISLPFVGFLVGIRYQELVNLHDRQEEETNRLIAIQRAPTPTPEKNQTIDTSTWKTYKNSLFGLSFMYPPEVNVEENKDNKNNPRVYIHPSFYNINKAGLPQDQNLYNKIFQIYITTQNNSKNLTASQFVANDISEITKNNTSDLTLQGMQKVAQKAVKSYTIGSKEGVYTVFGEAHRIPNIYITQNYRLYIITFNGPQGDEANSETQRLIDQILSTFKFLD